MADKGRVESDVDQRRRELVETYLDLSPTERDGVHRFIRDLRSPGGPPALTDELLARYRAEQEAGLAPPDVLRYADGKPVAS